MAATELIYLSITELNTPIDGKDYVAKATVATNPGLRAISIYETSLTSLASTLGNRLTEAFCE